MKITGEVRWTINGLTFTPRLVILLESIARLGKLQAAIAVAGLSYRRAWGLLDEAAQTLGEPLVIPRQGLGMQLSPMAERLLAGLVDAAGPLAAPIHEAENRLREALVDPDAHQAQPNVSLYASADLALAQFCNKHFSPEQLTLDCHASLDALAALRGKRCDLATFHLPAHPAASTVIRQLRTWLQLPGMRVAQLFARSIGLMVAATNPHHIRQLDDLIRPEIRFVNRPRTAASRLSLDFFLAQHKLKGSAISGYHDERPSQLAVATAIRQGQADAGWGNQALALAQELTFIPLYHEHFYLAARAATLRLAHVQSLLKTFHHTSFKHSINAFPGYRVTHTLSWQSGRELSPQFS